MCLAESKNVFLHVEPITPETVESAESMKKQTDTIFFRSLLLRAPPAQSWKPAKKIWFDIFFEKTEPGRKVCTKHEKNRFFFHDWVIEHELRTRPPE